MSAVKSDFFIPSQILDAAISPSWPSPDLPLNLSLAIPSQPDVAWELPTSDAWAPTTVISVGCERGPDLPSNVTRSCSRLPFPNYKLSILLIPTSYFVPESPIGFRKVTESLRRKDSAENFINFL